MQLLSGAGQLTPALLCDMAQRHVDDVEAFWRGMLTTLDQEDAGWPWAQKLRRAERERRYEAYAIESEALTQGLMLIETQWHRSQFAQRYPLVYVEAIASAPWNRRILEDPPYFRGVGQALLLFARQRSLELGYSGRVGLHALPGSEIFYRRQGMLDLEADPDKDGLVYFEYNALP